MSAGLSPDFEYLYHFFADESSSERANSLASSNSRQLARPTGFQIRVLICCSTSDRVTLVVPKYCVSKINLFLLGADEFIFSSSTILSSCVERAVTTLLTALNSVVSVNSWSDNPFGTFTGSKMYPKSLPVSSDFLIARPAACTMSTTLCFGSAKTTQSIEGILTPSVRQRALLRRAGP